MNLHLVAYGRLTKPELAKIPLKVLEMKEVDSGDPAVKCYDLKIACAGGRDSAPIPR